MSAEFLPLGMYRKRAGLTQAQLVRKTRLSRRGVQLMEKEDSIPHEENIVEYLKACGVQPEEAQLLAARLRHARGVTERRGRKPSRRGTLIALPRCGDLPDLGQDPRGWANMVLANVIATGAEAFKAEFNNNQTRVWQRRNSQWIAIASVNGQASGLPEIAMRSIRDVLGVRSHRDGRRLENNQDVKLEFRDFLGRGSFVETAAGCTLDLRLLPNKYETLADLNFPAALITRLRRCEKTANGLVLFCAPEVSDIQRSLRAFAMLAASHRRVLVITEDVGLGRCLSSRAASRSQGRSPNSFTWKTGECANPRGHHC